MKAIAYFEQLAKNYEGAISDTRSPTPLFAREIAQYARAAEQAIREKVERESPEPCPYCTDGVYYDVLGSPCKYEFCPMCGRRLAQNLGREAHP